MVILLIGVLAAVSSSLFTRQQSFSAFAARDQLVAVALLAQKRALANVNTTNAVTLTLLQGADDWTLTLAQGATTYPPRVVERAGAALSINGAVLTNGNSHIVTFNSDAETGANRQFVFSGDNSHSLCITSTGFAYIGTCQP